MTPSDLKIEYNYMTGTPDLEVKSRSVHDDSRTVNFTGVELARISSKRSGRLRWTEIEIYRTDGGLFVAHRIGRSVVVHDVSCMSISGKRLPGIEMIKNTDIPIESRVGCVECKPNIAKAMSIDPLSIRVETDRHWTSICESAEQLFNELHTTRHGERSLSYMASTLLVNAAEHDAEISGVVENHKLKN